MRASPAGARVRRSPHRVFAPSPRRRERARDAHPSSSASSIAGSSWAPSTTRASRASTRRKRRSSSSAPRSCQAAPTPERNGAVRYRPVPRRVPPRIPRLRLLAPARAEVCAYADDVRPRQAAADRLARIARLVGSGGAFKLFWNGQEALKARPTRRHDFDRRAAVPGLPAADQIQLVVKVCERRRPAS